MEDIVQANQMVIQFITYQYIWTEISNHFLLMIFHSSNATYRNYALQPDTPQISPMFLKLEL
jgi:hypothetical protein